MPFVEESYLFDPKNSYFVRITPPPPVDIFDRIRHFCDSVIVYQHDEEAKRPHVHCLFQNYKKSGKTLRNKLEEYGCSEILMKLFKPKPNHTHTIKYMAKGHYDPVYNTIYGDPYLQWVKDEWKDRTTIRLPIQDHWDGWMESENKPKREPFDAVRMEQDPNYTGPPQLKYEDVYGLSLRYMVGKYNGFVTMAARNMARQLTDTFAMRNKIPFR